MSALKELIKKEYVGIPYLWGGDTKKGMDCSGFIHTLFKDFYKKDIGNKTANQYMQESSTIDDEPEEGVLVFFSHKKQNHADHVGIMVSPTEFAHASTSKGVIITSLSNVYWKPRIIGFGKL